MLNELDVAVWLQLVKTSKWKMGTFRGLGFFLMLIRSILLWVRFSSLS